MISFPNAKINLGLHVTAKRADGYHNIETVFYPVGWSDILETVPDERKLNRRADVTITVTGNMPKGRQSDNLCVKAYQLLKQKHNLPPLKFYLHKLIPSGAGLGGGSSDAAFTLNMLNDMFKLGISSGELEKQALMLGSDCPFFIRNKPLLATGKGNVFEPVPLSLSGYFVSIVMPGLHISTEEAYRSITPKKPAVPLKEVISKPVREWRNLMTNDFETAYSTKKKYAAVHHIKEELYNHGALYASMSGSGSAVFGIFDEPVNPSSAFSGYRMWSGKMD